MRGGARRPGLIFLYTFISPMAPSGSASPADSDGHLSGPPAHPQTIAVGLLTGVARFWCISLGSISSCSACATLTGASVETVAGVTRAFIHLSAHHGMTHFSSTASPGERHRDPDADARNHRVPLSLRRSAFRPPGPTLLQERRHLQRSCLYLPQVAQRTAHPVDLSWQASSMNAKYWQIWMKSVYWREIETNLTLPHAEGGTSEPGSFVCNCPVVE